MNFNDYNYNELMVYLTQIIHGNGYISYVPTTYGELLTIYPTDRLRKLNLPFSRKKTYKLRLLSYNVYNDNFSILILSHLEPTEDASYFSLY